MRAGLAPMRERQARLLLEINSLVAEIRDASATTIEDFLALLDVALEHELDLAPEIAFYGPADYPIITRLFTRSSEQCAGFEFNAIDPRTVEPIGLDDPKTLAADFSPQREQKGAGTSTKEKGSPRSRASGMSRSRQ
jgi:hypothetical protein